MSTEEPQGPEKVLNIEVTLKGEEKRAVLVARVLDEDERIERDRALVRSSGDIVFDELPIASRLRVWALCTVRATVRDLPSWLNELIGVNDPLLFALFEEVERLERDYFRGFMDASSTEEERPLFQIVSASPPRAP